MNERKVTMLKALAQEPRTEKWFTHGFSAISPNVVVAYLGQLRAGGFIERVDATTFAITQGGLDQLARLAQQVITPPRTFGNAQTQGGYRSPAWPVRERADDHLNHKSLSPFSKERCS